MKKIISYGEIIWDVYPDKSVIGGAPLNFASHVSLCGAKSALISAVGDDSLGKDAVKYIGDFGVDCRYIKTAQNPTGQCIVSLDSNAVPQYNVLRDMAYDNIILDDKDIEGIKADGYNALYFGTLIQRSSVSRETLKRLLDSCKFETVICDVNLRPNCYDEESVRRCLETATVLKISMEEEPILRSFGMYTPENNDPRSIARALCHSFEQIEVVILTLGKDGSYAYNAKDGKDYSQSSIGDKVVSTVGAGDSFAAAWLTSFLGGESIEQCMQNAAELSGFVVAHVEAIPAR